MRKIAALTLLAFTGSVFGGPTVGSLSVGNTYHPKDMVASVRASVDPGMLCRYFVGPRLTRDAKIFSLMRAKSLETMGTLIHSSVLHELTTKVEASISVEHCVSEKVKTYKGISAPYVLHSVFSADASHVKKVEGTFASPGYGGYRTSEIEIDNHFGLLPDATEATAMLGKLEAFSLLFSSVDSGAANKVAKNWRTALEKDGYVLEANVTEVVSRETGFERKPMTKPGAKEMAPTRLETFKSFSKKGMLVVITTVEVRPESKTDMEILAIEVDEDSLD